MQLNIIYLNFRISFSIFFQKFSENNYFGNVFVSINKSGQTKAIDVGYS